MNTPSYWSLYQMTGTNAAAAAAFLKDSGKVC